jgi:hypothetical protein
MRLKLNGTYQFLAYADDVNLLEDKVHIDTVKEKTETLIYASKEVGTVVNIEKSKYMLTKQLWVCQRNNSSSPLLMLLPHVSIIRSSSGGIHYYTVTIGLLDCNNC